MFERRNSLLAVAALALSLCCVAHVRADVTGPYGWLDWSTAIGSQPTANLFFPVALSNFAAGEMVPGDTFAASFGVTIESSSALIRAASQGPAQLQVQSLGTAATVHWSSPITSVYYGGLGQLRINFYLGDTLLRSVWSPYVEAGFIASDPFDRMEFVTQSDAYLKLAGLQWVVPAPGASALLLICGAAASSRRRRA